MKITEAALELVRVRRVLIEAKKERRKAIDDAGFTRESHTCWREVGFEDQETSWCETCLPFRAHFEKVTELTRRRSLLMRTLERACNAASPELKVVELHFNGSAAATLAGLVKVGLYGSDIDEVCQRLVERALQEKFEATMRKVREAVAC